MFYSYVKDDAVEDWVKNCIPNNSLSLQKLGAKKEEKRARKPFWLPNPFESMVPKAGFEPAQP
jgi:hypothetical protein